VEVGDDPDRVVEAEVDRDDRVDERARTADRAGVGHVHDLHAYPRPAAPPLEPKRAGVLGEFGGLSLGVDGHTWTDKIWGYAGTSSKDELTRKYERLLREAWEMKDPKGLNAAIYTQITDVETEANGLLTYDRAVVKVDLDRVNAANRGDFSKVPVTREIVPTSREAALTWLYTFDKPQAGWFAANFDASPWKQGPGGFGTEGTPGAVVRTTWKTPNIWIRRSFNLPEVDPSTLLLVSIHDEDAEYYLNGVLAATVKGHVGSYDEIPISPAAQATLKPGKNVIAVHCHQTTGGQSIDVGIVEVKQAKK
jgi:transposase